MRRSLMLLGSQFIRNKEHFFADKKLLIKDFWKVSGANILSQLLLAFIIAEFAFPTPDIVYDFRRYISPDFAEFIKHGEHGGVNIRLDNSLRSFHVSEERVKRIHVRFRKNIPQTSLFLCYECGDMFTSKIPYDEHLLVHQAVSLCRQIYEFETKGLPFDDKQLHLMAGNEKDVSKSKKEVSLAERREAHLQSASISSRRNGVSGVPQRKRSFDVVAKRKMTDPLPDSLVCISKKKIPPKLKLKMPNPSPIDRQGKHDVPVVPVKSAPISIAHDISQKSSQGVPESNSTTCAALSAEVNMLQKRNAQSISQICIGQSVSTSEHTTTSESTPSNRLIELTSQQHQQEESTAKETVDSSMRLEGRKGESWDRRANSSRETKQTGEYPREHSVEDVKEVKAPRSSKSEGSVQLLQNLKECHLSDAGRYAPSSKHAKGPEESTSGRSTETLDRSSTSKGSLLNPSAGLSSESKESRGSGAVFGTVATLKKLSTQAVAQNRSSSPLPLPPQKCLICDYHSSQGWEMVEHVVRVHKVSISKVEKTHFIDGEWTSKTSHPSAQKCEYCTRTFMESTDYFLHIIVCHRNSMFAVGANRLNCVVHLAHPHLRVQIINITMRRPTNLPV
uniref:C2H2-type domain-containing protein n=1 Tax=Ascaris lumbricoides TaxID=6252 RepID=A0A0M3I3K2_ASCLU